MKPLARARGLVAARTECYRHVVLALSSGLTSERPAMHAKLVYVIERKPPPQRARGH